MKVIVVGCTHAGTAAVVNIKEKYPNSEITVYEKNDNISFLSCGIALNVGNVVKETESLFYNSPENLSKMGITANMKHEVLDINFDKKEVTVKNLLTDEIVNDNYDKLVLTLGSWPIVPRFEGGNLDNIVLCKNYDHAKEINKRAVDAKNVVIIGAGYIGVELAEAFEMQGKNTTLIDAEERIMSKYLDKEFTDIAEEEFKSRGVNLVLGEKVSKFVGENDKVSKVVTDKGDYKADLVILCIGFRPNTELVKGKIDTLENGAIVIDEYMQTSKKDVFAAGDCCVVRYNPTDENRYIPLATNAVRMGTLVAKNLEKPTLKYMGTQGTSGIKIYDKCIASTGLTEEMAVKTTNMNIETSIITDNYRPEFMPTNESVTLKIVFDKDSRRLLGAQIISDLDLTPVANTLSIAVQNKMTVEELAITDFFFQPHFNKPWNIINLVALKCI